MKLNMDPEKLDKKIKRAKKVASGRYPFFYKKGKIEGVLRKLSAIEAASGRSESVKKTREELIGALLKREEKRRYSRVSVGALRLANRYTEEPENVERILKLLDKVKATHNKVTFIIEMYGKRKEYREVLSGKYKEAKGKALNRYKNKKEYSRLISHTMKYATGFILAYSLLNVGNYKYAIAYSLTILGISAIYDITTFKNKVMERLTSGKEVI